MLNGEVGCRNSGNQRSALSVLRFIFLACAAPGSTRVTLLTTTQKSIHFHRGDSHGGDHFDGDRYAGGRCGGDRYALAETVMDDGGDWSAGFETGASTRGLGLA